MKTTIPVLIAFLLFACGNPKNDGKLTSTNAVQEDENTDVNANEQAKPNIIVVPSDELLQKFGMLKQENAQGKTIYIRDFKGYLLKDPNAKFIISTIQAAFINVGFPLNDLEQTLKSVEDQEIIDDADNIQKDVKTMLLLAARPDVIVELNYDLVTDNRSRNLKRSLTYTIRSIDAFSNKVVATVQKTGFKDSLDITADGLMKQALIADMPNFTKQLNSYFADIIQKGREITVRVGIDKGIKLSMDDNCLNANSYSEWIVDYVKKNTLKGAYKLERNTETELFFRNVRIKTMNEDGTQYSAYDFAREMKKALDSGCGMKSKNKTQGLGDAYIVIKGM
ncbi:MAG: DUF6175 family protein [Bacteroidota bacterium]